MLFYLLTTVLLLIEFKYFLFHLMILTFSKLTSKNIFWSWQKEIHICRKFYCQKFFWKTLKLWLNSNLILIWLCCIATNLLFLQDEECCKLNIMLHTQFFGRFVNSWTYLINNFFSKQFFSKRTPINITDQKICSKAVMETLVKYQFSPPIISFYLYEQVFDGIT